MEKQPSKLGYFSKIAEIVCTNSRSKISPNLNFYFIKIAHCATYIKWLCLKVEDQEFVRTDPLLSRYSGLKDPMDPRINRIEAKFFKCIIQNCDTLKVLELTNFELSLESVQRIFSLCQELTDLNIGEMVLFLVKNPLNLSVIICQQKLKN